jgi:hypothetical protein
MEQGRVFPVLNYGKILYTVSNVRKETVLGCGYGCGNKRRINFILNAQIISISARKV